MNSEDISVAGVVSWKFGALNILKGFSVSEKIWFIYFVDRQTGFLGNYSVIEWEWLSFWNVDFHDKVIKILIGMFEVQRVLNPFCRLLTYFLKYSHKINLNSTHHNHLHQKNRCRKTLVHNKTAICEFHSCPKPNSQKLL